MEATEVSIGIQLCGERLTADHKMMKQEAQSLIQRQSDAEHQNTKPFGPHVTIDGKECDFCKMTDYKNIYDILNELPSLVGMTDKVSQLAMAMVLSLLILAFVFASKEFRENRDNWLAGLVVGAVVVAGWYATGHLGFGENPETMELAYMGTDSRGPESMTFVGPLAYTMDLWAYWRDKHVTFGVASVFGVVAGSFIYSLFSRSFRWEYFNSPQDMFRHLVGAVLMGFGGITAMGCTIGQAVTGVSTLAISSFIVFFGIVAGSAITMKVQYYLMMRDA